MRKADKEPGDPGLRADIEEFPDGSPTDMRETQDSEGELRGTMCILCGFRHLGKFCPDEKDRKKDQYDGDDKIGWVERTRLLLKISLELAFCFQDIELCLRMLNTRQNELRTDQRRDNCAQTIKG